MIDNSDTSFIVRLDKACRETVTEAVDSGHLRFELTDDPNNWDIVKSVYDDSNTDGDM